MSLLSLDLNWEWEEDILVDCGRAFHTAGPVEEKSRDYHMISIQLWGQWE